MTDFDNNNPLAPPPWLNAPPIEPYPFEETYDLREGPELHPSLLGLLPYVGMWRGRGRGGYPTLEADFDYAQEIKISHDGRPFLFYESRAWVIDVEGNPIKPSNRETATACGISHTAVAKALVRMRPYFAQARQTARDP